MFYNYVIKNLIYLVLLFYCELTIYDTEIEDNYDIRELIGLKY